MGFPSASAVKNPSVMQEMWRRCGFSPWVQKILWRRKWQPTPGFLPGESHGQRSLAGCSLRCRKKSDTAEHAHMGCSTEQPSSGRQLHGGFSLGDTLSHYLSTSKALQCKMPQTEIIIFPTPTTCPLLPHCSAF